MITRRTFFLDSQTAPIESSVITSIELPMATASPPANLLPTMKALVFDAPIHTLSIHHSYPIPTPIHSKNDHLVHVKTTALCARELAWPFEFPDAIYAENPENLITPGYDLAGTVITAPPRSPFHPGDKIFARTLPSRPGQLPRLHYRADIRDGAEAADAELGGGGDGAAVGDNGLAGFV